MLPITKQQRMEKEWSQGNISIKYSTPERPAIAAKSPLFSPHLTILRHILIILLVLFPFCGFFTLFVLLIIHFGNNLRRNMTRALNMVRDLCQGDGGALWPAIVSLFTVTALGSVHHVA